MEEKINIGKTRKTVQPSQETARLLETYKSETDKKLEEAKLSLIEAIKKIEKIDNVVYVVVIILLVMVATLLIDSFHINSATYKEYSEKLISIETSQKTNKALLEQILDLSEQSKQDRLIIKSLLVR